MLALVAGCVANHPPRAALYTGPTQSMQEVVQEINRNNEKLPTLWATLNYTANIVDERRHEHFVSGDGVLLYQRPLGLRLVGKAAIGTVFEVGSNPETFWLKLVPDVDTMWWGRYEDLVRTDPARLPIPIRPDYLLDVLGVSTIPTNFSALPAPIMRFAREQDAYDLLWIGKLPDRFVAMREVWYDRQSKRPKLIRLYDANGRVVLSATFGQFRRVEIEKLLRDQWPEVAGDYKLTFPENGSRIEFTLDVIRLNTTGPTGLKIPNPRSFTLPNPDAAGVEHVYRIGAE